MGFYRPIILDRGLILSRKLYFFQVDFFRRRGPASCQASWRIAAGSGTRVRLRSSLSSPRRSRTNFLAGWAEDSDEIILRRCPICEQDSIVGHGWRRKQAHDEYRDWIRIRRGRCGSCGKTFTFLPVFSLPYTHYSLLARCQALLRRFVEHCSWEKAVPKCKDADRVPDSCTVRRWSEGVDESEPIRSFVLRTASAGSQWLESCSLVFRTKRSYCPG